MNDLFAKLISKVRSKLKSRSGVTLAELMATCALLVIVSAMMVTVTRIGFKVYENVSSISEGQILCSTLSSVIKDELRYTSSVTLGGDGEVNSFFSDNFGSGGDEGFEIDKDGQLMIGNELVISKWSYVNGLKVDEINVHYLNNKFTVKLTIMDSHSNVVAKSEFDVKPVNEIETGN